MSSSRTAVPFAQAAHSGLTPSFAAAPNTVAPPLRGWPSAMSRAETTGRRLIAAIATEALSIMRLMIMAVTSRSTATLSAATSAIFQASCSSRASFAFEGCTLTSCRFMRFPLIWSFGPDLRRMAPGHGQGARLDAAAARGPYISVRTIRHRGARRDRHRVRAAEGRVRRRAGWAHRGDRRGRAAARAGGARPYRAPGPAGTGRWPHAYLLLDRLARHRECDAERGGGRRHHGVRHAVRRAAAGDRCGDPRREDRGGGAQRACRCRALRHDPEDRRRRRHRGARGSRHLRLQALHL